MPDTIDRLFLATRRSAFLYRVVLLTRALLAAGFIPTGLVKLLGRRFTTIATDVPVGAFFEALYQSGLYWRFLGATQVIAGLLLLLPRIAHLGAAIFLGVMVNIFIITISLPFAGTPLITGMMLAAVLFLCFWDYHRFRPLFSVSPADLRPTQHRLLDRWEAIGFMVFTLALLAFFMVTRGLAPAAIAIPAIAAGVLAGLSTAVRFFWLRFAAPRSHAA